MMRLFDYLKRLVPDILRVSCTTAAMSLAVVSRSATYSIPRKISKFSDQWAPRIIAQMNDYHFKHAKIQGEFVWHSHADTDEVFIVFEGEMRIHFRDLEVDLRP